MEERLLVNQLRSRLEQILQERPELRVKRALNRLNESDVLLQRHLRRKNHDVDRTIKHAIRVLSFYRQMDIDSIEARQFYPEIFICPPLTMFGQDRMGNQCVWYR